MSAPLVRSKYRAVALVETNDRGYLRHVVRSQINKTSIRRDRTPNPQAMWGHTAEKIVRWHLGTQIQLSPRRVLSYQEPARNGVARRYRELDAVAVGTGKAITLFEIKCSVIPSMLRSGGLQLDTAEAILGSVYQPIHRVLVVTAPPWADVAGIRLLLKRPMLRDKPLQLLERADDPVEMGQIGLLWLSPESLDLPRYDAPALETAGPDGPDDGSMEEPMAVPGEDSAAT